MPHEPEVIVRPIEIGIDAIEGKLKLSQNRPQADRRGVAEGLAQAEPEMSELVRRYATHIYRGCSVVPRTKAFASPGRIFSANRRSEAAHLPPRTTLA